MKTIDRPPRLRIICFSRRRTRKRPARRRLKFILRRRFERGSAFTARLNEERPAVPRDGPFLGSVGAGIYADVFVQESRAYGDHFEGGNLELFTVVDVDRDADNVLDRVNSRWWCRRPLAFLPAGKPATTRSCRRRRFP